MRMRMDTSPKLSMKSLLRLSVVLTLLASALSGFDLAFTTFALSIKETYNFTQAQVEVAASFSAFGMAMSAAEVILNALLGYKYLFAFAWVVFPGASIFLSVAPAKSDFFHDNPLPIYIALFLITTASAFACMSMTSIVVANLPDKHTGKFVGAYCAMLSFGKLAYGFLIHLFFLKDSAGFFLTIAVASLVIYTATFISLHKLKVEVTKHENTSYEILKDVEDSKTCKPYVQEIVPLREMVSSPFFHFGFWPILIGFSCALSLMNNITAIGQSVGFSSLMVLVYIMSIVALVTKLLCGYIIDRYQSISAAMLLAIVTNIVFCMSVLLGIFHLTLTTMYLFSVFIGVGIGGGYSIFAPLFALKFGKTHYRFLTAIFFGLVPLFMFVIQVIIGILYDSRSTSTHIQTYLCLGSDCYYGIFLMIFMLTCIVVLCYVLLLVNEILKSKSRSKTQK